MPNWMSKCLCKAARNGRAEAMTFMLNGKPLFCTGIILWGETTGELWSKVSIEGAKCPRTIMSNQSRMLEYAVKKYNLKWVFARADAEWSVAQKYLKRLKFEEFGLIEDHGKPYYLYRRSYNG